MKIIRVSSCILLLFIIFCSYSYAKQKSDYELIVKEFKSVDAVYPLHYERKFFDREYIVIANKKIWIAIINRPHHPSKLMPKQLNRKIFIGIIP